MSRALIGATGLVGLAAVLAGVTLGADVFRSLLQPQTEPSRPISLQRPAVGKVRADYLPDGTPVWAMGHADGSVDVLSGFDTHTPGNFGSCCGGAGPARRSKIRTTGQRGTSSGSGWVALRPPVSRPGRCWSRVIASSSALAPPRRRRMRDRSARRRRSAPGAAVLRRMSSATTSRAGGSGSRRVRRSSPRRRAGSYSRASSSPIDPEAAPSSVRSTAAPMQRSSGEPRCPRRTWSSARSGPIGSSPESATES